MAFSFIDTLMIEVLLGRKTMTHRMITPGEKFARGGLVVLTEKDRLKWEVGRTYAVKQGRIGAAMARIQIEQIAASNVIYITSDQAKMERCDPNPEATDLQQKLAFLKTILRLNMPALFKQAEEISIQADGDNDLEYMALQDLMREHETETEGNGQRSPFWAWRLSFHLVPDSLTDLGRAFLTQKGLWVV